MNVAGGTLRSMVTMPGRLKIIIIIIKASNGTLCFGSRPVQNRGSATPELRRALPLSSVP